MSRRLPPMLLLLLAACGRQPAPLAEKPIEPPRPRTSEFARSTGSHVLADDEGRKLWRLKGNLRIRVEDRVPAVEIVDVAMESLVEGIDAQGTVGRARYRQGEEDVQFDRRLNAVWPSQRSSLRAERARFHIDSKRFRVRDPSRAVRGDVVLESRYAEVAMGLETMALREVSARGTLRGANFTAQAKSADGDADANIALHQVTGTFQSDSGPVRFRAPKAAWKPGPAALNFAAGVTFEHQGATLTAEQATWESKARRIVTRGATTLRRGDLTATGAGTSVDLVTETATMESIRVNRGPLAMTAQRGEVDRDGNLALRGVTARRDGVTVTAPSFRYTAASKQIVADGGLDLTARGATLHGTRLTAPEDLSTATLTGASAAGSRGGRRWTVTAPTATWSESGGAVLSRALGTMVDADRRVTARAGTVRVPPDGGPLAFAGGVTVESPAEGLRLTADRGTYDPSARVLIARGNVRGQVRGLAIRSGESWRYEFAPIVTPGRTAPSAGETPARDDPPAPAEEETGATGSGDRPDLDDGEGPQAGGPAVDDPGAAGRPDDSLR